MAEHLKHVLIIDGHPDPEPAHFVHALADAYAEGALNEGHKIRRIGIATLDFPLITSRKMWEASEPPKDIALAQEAIAWCDHMVIAYPLWLGDMPALLKGFLEQVLRPGFAIDPKGTEKMVKPLNGRSARIIVTMGMPAMFYQFYYGAGSLKSLKRNILSFVGFRPVRESMIGNVEASAEDRKGWLEDMFNLGKVAG
jgi:putative NADPH-quinone reductase